MALVAAGWTYFDYYIHKREAAAGNYACGANYHIPGWFNYACGANYPYQALKGGLFCICVESTNLT